MNNTRNTSIPHVSILVLNWNGAALLPDCLNSLAKQTYQNYTVVVTDNGSTDASIDIINKYDRYVLVQLSENKGFAGGNNAGYEHIKKSIPSKYIVLLNNDTKVDNKWLEELVNCAEQHEDAGSIVSKVRFFDKPNHLHHTGILLYPDLTTTNRGMYEEDKGQYNKFEEVFGGIGCSVIIRVEALGPDALFEDRFFAYREDDEVAWRLRFNGYKNYYCPKSILWHKHSATTQPFSAFKLFHTERNRIYNLIMYMPLWYIPVSFIYTLKRYIQQSQCQDRRQAMDANNLSFSKTLWFLLKSYSSAFINMPYFIKRRCQIQKSKKISNKQIMQIIKDYSTNRI